MKHELTLQQEVTLYLENVVPGLDFSFTFTRNMLKKAMDKSFAYLKKVLITAFDSTKLHVFEDIDRIELTGGGSRLPLLVDFINETFGNQIPIFRSMNTEEAQVLGAGYVLASRKPGYLQFDINFKPFPLFHIETLPGKLTHFVYNNSDKLPCTLR